MLKCSLYSYPGGIGLTICQMNMGMANVIWVFVYLGQVTLNITALSLLFLGGQFASNLVLIWILF